MTNIIEKDYIKYYKGNAPLILSAPHGGDYKPKNIKTRTKGDFEKDDYTYELSELIIDEFYKQTNLQPYGIIAQISREKVDLNRSRKEAFEDKNTEVIYETFHEFIKESRKKVMQEFGKGLYIDVHGQSHPNAFIEFGYLLDNHILALNNTKLEKYKKLSSINTLSDFSEESFVNQLKGESSLATLMCMKGYDSIPSIKFPYAIDDNYYEGTHNTINYGSLDGKSINGIQIEFPYIGCRDSKENREKCAKAMVDSILKFFEINFQMNLKEKKI